MATAAAANLKNVLHVRGLDDSVDEPALYRAFVAFGDVAGIVLPRDVASKKHRGFAFVEFEDPEDAAHALDNMHEAEFFGRVLRVHVAAPNSVRGRAVWTQADEWYKQQQAQQQAQGEQPPGAAAMAAGPIAGARGPAVEEEEEEEDEGAEERKDEAVGRGGPRPAPAESRPQVVNPPGEPPGKRAKPSE
jgi:peptidyl-prolyl isomerase E (cyclophilin E)